MSKLAEKLNTDYVIKPDIGFLNILIKNGFLELSSKEDRTLNRRTFKMDLNSRKLIYVEPDMITLMNGVRFQDRRQELTETELRILILYFKLETWDFARFRLNKIYNFSRTEQVLNEMREELTTTKNENTMNRINRIFEKLNSVKI